VIVLRLFLITKELASSVNMALPVLGRQLLLSDDDSIDDDDNDNGNDDAGPPADNKEMAAGNAKAFFKGQGESNMKVLFLMAIGLKKDQPAVNSSEENGSNQKVDLPLVDFNLPPYSNLRCTSAFVAKPKQMKDKVLCRAELAGMKTLPRPMQ